MSPLATFDGLRIKYFPGRISKPTKMSLTVSGSPLNLNTDVVAWGGEEGGEGGRGRGGGNSGRILPPRACLCT
jgi:hypothetical protein